MPSGNIKDMFKQKPTKQSILKTIVESYEKNLFSLGLKYQSHWSTRMWRVNPNERYLRTIYNSFQLETLGIFPRLLSWLNKEKSAKDIGLEILENYKPAAPKKKLRLNFYREKPEIIFYLNLISYIFRAKSLELHKLEYFKEFYNNAINKLIELEIEKKILDKNLIDVNPSAVANTIYYLKYLGIGNQDSALLTLYKDHWLSFVPQNKLDWQNKVYALTHLIIAATYFYQQFADPKIFAWILDFFEKNIHEIIENTNPDITAEVGLCYRLCKINNNTVISRVEELLLSRFDSAKGYIPKEENDSMSKAEHRNIVAILFLTPDLNLNPGPDILKFLKEEKLNLFFPENGHFVGIREVED